MKPFVPALTLAVIGVACSPPKPPAPSSTPPPPPDISNFRTWKRATNEPFQISDVIAKRCAYVPADQDFLSRTKKEPPMFPDFPHRKFFVHVYVNDIGKSSMRIGASAFPPDSVVVKEKFKGVQIGPKYELKLGKSEVITVMRKRESGYDSANGDWEYFVGNPSTGLLFRPKEAKLKSCQSCHSFYKDRDFITKSYLMTTELLFQKTNPPEAINLWNKINK